MHQKHGIDRGTEVTEASGAWGGYPIPSVSGVPPPPEKLQRTSTQLYCPWSSGFGSASFQSVLPVVLFNCSQPHDVQTLHGLSE